MESKTNSLYFFIPWTIGFLFTLGITTGDKIVNSVPYWNKFLTLLVYYILWPLILGTNFR